MFSAKTASQKIEKGCLSLNTQTCLSPKANYTNVRFL